MNILGIDTATAASAACVLRDDGEAFEHPVDAQRLTTPPAHAAELMPAIQLAMEEAGLGYEDLDALGVGVGPGGFTGLRIGVSTARALAGSAGLQLRPVSSLKALSEGIEAESRLAVIDARRGEVFARLEDEEVADPTELAPRVAARGLQVLAAGDGAIRFRDVFEAAGVEVAPAGSADHVIRGLSICRLALDASPAAPQTVLPVYLREPDAKPLSNP